MVATGLKARGFAASSWRRDGGRDARLEWVAGRSMDDWTSIVMAAGRGTRMRSSRPKVLHTVAGVPMVSHVLNAVAAVHGSAPILVVSPDTNGPIAAAIGNGAEYVEQADPLGTGHALLTALVRVPYQSAHILLLNADLPLITAQSLASLVALHQDRRAAITLLTAKLPAAQAADLGRLKRGARGKPIAIVEAAEAEAASGTVEINVGVYAFDASWLRGTVPELAMHGSGEYYVTDLLAMAVAEGRRVEALPLDHPEEAMGVNTRAQLAKAEQAMQARLREMWMERGVTLVDPATAYIDSTVELAEDVTLFPNTALRGLTRVGEGTVIGPNAQISDSLVGGSVRIGQSTIEGAVIEDGAQVGQYSYLRAGTHLEPEAFVGSHAEIKNSRVGTGAHIGHFSYVGDALIGAGANIGAGTVTCNYDGVSKHVTEIGEGAFIGSDSLLVAPVKVGARAVTGAGAVVTRDVAPGETVAGVPARVLNSARRPADMAAGSEGGNPFG
ncbi:MAG: bifunctional UDP-N-acetylglucosamine diphosphorylase/glucosamine-1-phosphate N-acetyltransferase GlmU [Dehalococcoidia bacterium]